MRALSALLFSHVLAVLVAFALYRRFVFRVSGNVWRDLARFESVYVAALVFNAVALPALVHRGVNSIFAQAVITVLAAFGSYLGHREWSFKRAKQ